MLDQHLHAAPDPAPDDVFCPAGSPPGAGLVQPAGLDPSSFMFMPTPGPAPAPMGGLRLHTGGAAGGGGSGGDMGGGDAGDASGAYGQAGSAAGMAIPGYGAYSGLDPNMMAYMGMGGMSLMVPASPPMRYPGEGSWARHGAI